MKKLRIKGLALSLLIISDSSVAAIIADYPQPDYCSRDVLTPTEEIICGDKELSKVDLELSALLKKTDSYGGCEPTNRTCLDAEAIED